LLAGDLTRATDAFTEAWSAMRLVLQPAWTPTVPGIGAQEANDPQAQLMQPNGRIMSQVFWRFEGSDFDEHSSERGFTPEVATRRTLRLTIPRGLDGPPQLRIDLADVPGIVQLFGIRLFIPEGAVLWEWDGQAATLAALDHSDLIVMEGVSEAGVFLYLSSRDPNLLLPACPGLEALARDGGCLELDFDWHGTIRRAADA
jgi:hypothetical protein